MAKALPAKEVFEWLVTQGYYPEPYVLPPTFVVKKAPDFHSGGYYRYDEYHRRLIGGVEQPQSIHFPKTDHTDRTFGFVHPELHADMARVVANYWSSIVAHLFPNFSLVYSYSFPIPVDGKQKGALGRLRSGRMIYEWIEMAEKDLAAEAYRYGWLVNADVANFYSSIYTHSIAWAVHGKKRARANRKNLTLYGNLLDQLVQKANDDCTNGIPTGPAISDLVAEIVLAGVDRYLTSSMRAEGLGSTQVLAVRFKDDYRILCRTREVAMKVTKLLQAALREFRLQLNDGKTRISALPDGLFRVWRTRYDQLNPHPKSWYDIKRFEAVFKGVLEIDRHVPGTGVVDRFLADLVRRDGTLRLRLNRRDVQRVVSLLLLLAKLRPKAYPKALAIVEALIKSPVGRARRDAVVSYLKGEFEALRQNEGEATYRLVWLAYFLASNKYVSEEYKRSNAVRDPVLRVIWTSQPRAIWAHRDFKIAIGAIAAARETSLLWHLEVFSA
ncbi:MAG: RNA-directed DNA polymerase [Trueperaceae bacterium]|nr:RNA-directed DNA polymerase [Trueperaceae bacterium]